MVNTVTSAQSTDAWLDVLQQLMPQGVAWSRDINANQTKLLLALARHLADIDGQADTLQLEMIPNQAHLLLTEYEHYLGLPDCGEQQTPIEERRRAIELKDKRAGGHAAWQIEELAAEFGFKITVHERIPHHCLRNCLTPLYPEHYRHILDIYVLTRPETRFTCIDNVLIPLTTGNRTPECILNRCKLAGKYYNFYYKEIS